MRYPNLRALGISLGCLMVVGLAATVFCRADSISSNLILETADQSMWSSGAATDLTVPLFDTRIPVNFNQTFGGISTPTLCVFHQCWNPVGSVGTELTAAMNGYIEPSMSMVIGGGSVNATIPVNVNLGFPDTVALNHPITITSSGMYGSNAFFQSFSPGVALNMNIGADLFGNVNATLCVGGCASQGVTLSTDGPQTLNLFNASLIPGKTQHLGPDFVATVGIPYVGTSATTGSPVAIDPTSPMTLMAAHISDEPFVSAAVDVSNIIAAGLGLPPLDGSVDIGSDAADFNYNLLRATVGFGLNAKQSFTLTTTPEVAYTMDFLGPHPLIETTNYAPVGTPLTFNWAPGAEAVQVTPQYTMMATLKNTSGVVPAFEFGFNALSVGFGPLSLPNLVKLNYALPLGNGINFSSDAFALQGWNAEYGSTFTIDAASPTPEPPTLFLFATGILLLAGLAWRRRREFIQPHA